VSTRPFSLHPYQYADADPTNKIDPSGHFSVMETSFVQGFVSGLQRAWGFVRAQAAKCAALEASIPLALAAAVPDILYFSWTSFRAGVHRVIVPPIPLPRGGVLVMDVRYPEGAAEGDRSNMSARYSVTFDKIQGSIGFVRKNGVTRIIGNAAVTYPIKCGVPLARVGIGLRKPSHLSSSVLLEIFFDLFSGASAQRESGTHTLAFETEIP